MTDFTAEVLVTLKPLVNDPPGLVIRDALRNLGFHEVTGARSGKLIRLQLDADNRVDAEHRVEQMCQKLLANPVIEDFSFDVREKVGGLMATFGVVVFPGTWSDRDSHYAVHDILGQEARYIWHKQRDLSGLDCVILPGGFSYGDHLRCGAVARFSPVMASVVEFAQRGGLVIGICNGFQVLCESHLLPGALMRNDTLQFRCQQNHLRVENADTPFTTECAVGDVLSIPISHGEGNYFCDRETLASLEANHRVVFHYSDADGNVSAASNPNGSIANIAGIVNETGNVLGMMPHPERACEDLLGSVDGLMLFRSIIRNSERVFAR